MTETMEANFPDERECQQLRVDQYNATIVRRIDVTEDLARFQIKPDVPFEPFLPGQYVALGIGNWEPRLADSQTEPVPDSRLRKLVRRAYSISCPMVDPREVAACETADAVAARERLLTVDRVDFLEFYIALVRRAPSPDAKPPALTPRLFCLGAGDRIAMEKKITGKYVLGTIEPTDTVLMLGTGTGEAPHNAMAATLLARGHRGKVIVATSVRFRCDVGYAAEHQTLMRQFPNYKYLALTTREPENLDASLPHYVGKQYLQTLFVNGQLAKLVGDDLSPQRTHVFLCGNPDMIGIVAAGTPMPSNPGMVPLLRAAGFRDDDGTAGAGQIRYEKYW